VSAPGGRTRGLRNAGLTAARQEALRILAGRHPEELAELYADALAAAGIEPPATERPCPCGRGTLRRLLSQPWPKACGRCGEGT
jgi:hypothetical protein